MNRVSVIIPSLNEEGYIESILSDLAKQTHAPHEVIVIDAGSQDKTQNIVKGFQNVRLIIDEPPVGNQRTKGGKESTSDILIFLDSDTHIEEDFIEHVTQEFISKNYDLAWPWYVPYKSTKTITGTYYAIDGLMYIFQKLTPSGAGSCIIVTREAFDSAGGFEPQYKFDDIVFIRKAAKKRKFGMLKEKVYVSDRRFKKYGTIRMIATYVGLSILFFFGLFKFSNAMPYTFGEYSDKKQQS